MDGKTGALADSRLAAGQRRFWLRHAAGGTVSGRRACARSRLSCRCGSGRTSKQAHHQV